MTSEGSAEAPHKPTYDPLRPGKNVNPRTGDRAYDPWVKDPDEPRSNAQKVADWFLGTLFEKPVEWVRDNLSDRFRGPKYYYYHRKFNRVPDVDQCYMDDLGCFYEADKQFRRDMKVDSMIIHILRGRYSSCMEYYEFYTHPEKCERQWRDYKDSTLNYFIKYGDIGGFTGVHEVYMKQKHRLIWERRERERIKQLMDKYPHLYQNEIHDPRDCPHCVTGKYPTDMDGRKAPPEPDAGKEDATKHFPHFKQRREHW